MNTDEVVLVKFDREPPPIIVTSVIVTEVIGSLNDSVIVDCSEIETKLSVAVTVRLGLVIS